MGLEIPLYCLVERDTAVLTRGGGTPCPVEWGTVPCHVRVEYPQSPILARFPPGGTWDRTSDRTSVRTRGYPSGKDLGPEAEKGPGNRGSDTPPVDRQMPVKTLPSRRPTYARSKKVMKILLNVPNCVKFYQMQWASENFASTWKWSVFVKLCLSTWYDLRSQHIREFFFPKFLLRTLWNQENSNATEGLNLFLCH